MALNLVATGKTEFVPDGYRHAFLIRNPTMSVPSLYRTLSRQNVDGLPEIIPAEAGIRDMWALYEYIRDVKGQTPMVIDADDDLLRDPATTMKKFCDFVGFEFKESMLRWTPVHPEEWVFHDEWYDTLLSTTGFVKNTETPSCPQKVDVSSYPTYVQDTIRDCKPYYEKLYELRTA
ncbi:uncharacterized protein [Ptychodera flava]|uniref:uncharacterized protein n=1 Tax=Ptychodera flava TaxID=63121 RepID=UPI003969D952